MAQQTKSGLQTNLSTDLADNVTGNISAADVRGNLIDFTDSVPFTLTADNVLSGSFSGSFQGDGSGLTGVTGEWDGSLNGNASITGSLIVTGNTTFGDAITDRVYVSGGLVLSSDTGASANAIKITNASHARTVGASSIDVKSDSTQIPGIILHNQDDTTTFRITMDGSDGAELVLSSDLGGDLSISNPGDGGLLLEGNNIDLTSYNAITSTGSWTHANNLEVNGTLTVDGNTAFGNALTDITTISGSIYLTGNASGNSSATSLKISNAIHSSNSGSIDITANNAGNIPSIFLRSADNVPNMYIGSRGTNTAAIALDALGQTGADLNVEANQGTLLLYGYEGVDIYTGNGVVLIESLPTTEPATSGQLWLSGSAGSNSKILCVRD